MIKDRYKLFENKIEQMRKHIALWCGQCVKSHPFMKNPMVAFLGLICLIGRLLLYFMKIFCNLMDLVTHRKKESAIVFAWVVLVIVAIVSITKIVQIYAAEAKQEKEIKAQGQKKCANLMKQYESLQKTILKEMLIRQIHFLVPIKYQIYGEKFIKLNLG